MVAMTACRTTPTASQKCATLDQLFCPRRDLALVCEPSVHGRGQAQAASPSAAWVEVPCKGPRGCETGGAASECDDTLASEGDPCPRGPPQDYACTPDRGHALECREGRFGVWRACRGPGGCQVVDGRSVQCDTTLGEAGDPCAKKGTYSCSTDRSAMLVCDGAQLVASSSCRGPAACQVERDSNRVSCDDAVAAEGDPCDQPRRIACAVDRKAELVCEANRYTRKRACLRSDCRLEGTELFCD